MRIDPASDKPIFLQIAEGLEDDIFTGIFEEEAQIPSTNEMAAMWKINPHTVLKGMNLLVERQLIEKKRGIGMFVLPGAQERVRSVRKEEFLNKEVLEVVAEAKKLGITAEQLKQLIERGYDA